MKPSIFETSTPVTEFQDYYNGMGPMSATNPACNGNYEYQVVVNPTTTQREIRIRRRGSASRYI